MPAPTRNASGEPLRSRSLAILVCAVGILSYLVPTLEGRLIANPQTVWPLWPSCAILVSALMFVERRVWPLVMAVSFIGIIVFDLQIGVPVSSIGWFILADTVEVLIVACGLRYYFGGVPQLDSIGSLAKYSLFAVVLGPFFGALLSANGIGLDYWSGWRVSFFSEALAFVTLTPAILSWGSDFRAGVRRSLTRYLECATQLSGLAVFGFFAFTTSQPRSLPLLLYSLLPFLLWAALRLGPTCISTSIISVSFLTVWGAVQGRGPFAEGGPVQDPWSIQLFLIFAAVIFLILTAVVEERKRTQMALSHVSGKLIQAQEEERVRIARELHDDIGQRISLMCLTLHQAESALSKGPREVREQINDVHDQAMQIASDLQAVSHELHSSTLEHLGLVQAARGWCQQIGQRKQLDIVFSSRDVPRALTPDVSLCLFRVLQEAVQNSSRHGEAKKIDVELWGEPRVLHLKVRDTGRGFNVSAASLSKGLGLTSMQERVRLMQGTIQISSKPMGGTSVHAQIPLNPAPTLEEGGSPAADRKNGNSGLDR